MNRLILPAALALALSGSVALASQAQAQQAPAPIERPDAAQQSAPAPDTQQPMHRHHKAPNAQRELARLSQQLNLTPDQSSKLGPILADREQKVAALKANDQLADSDKHHQMHAIQKSTEEQLATVLTPDQLQQMKDMRKNHEHHGRHGGPQATPDQAPPPPPPSAL
ncbi:MAG: hypothetical protein V4555_02275 [Acidobacteriota bacterium]